MRHHRGGGCATASIAQNDGAPIARDYSHLNSICFLGW